MITFKVLCVNPKRPTICTDHKMEWNANLKRSVFKRDLKVSSELGFLRVSVRAFHSLGATTEKALSPQFTSRGTTKTTKKQLSVESQCPPRSVKPLIDRGVLGHSNIQKL